MTSIKASKCLEEISRQPNGIPKQSQIDISIDRITSFSNIPPIEPVIRIGESIFASKGDISFITGLPKAGKSSVSIFLIATALTEDLPLNADTLQIRTTYCEGRPVVYVDTEQPRGYTKRMVSDINKFLGLSHEPDNLHIYNLRKYTRPEKYLVVKAIIEQTPDAHLIIIDGLADLVKDPNDYTESSEILDYFMKVAEINHTTIVLYLHENPGTNKMRGNLGSEAERKCGGTVTVKKDRVKQVHTLEARMIRGAADFPDIFFRYSLELGRMVSLDPKETEELKHTKEKAPEQKLYTLAQECFCHGAEKELEHKELKNRIRLWNTPGKEVSDGTANNRIRALIQANFIVKNESGYYSLADKQKVQILPKAGAK